MSNSASTNSLTALVIIGSLAFATNPDEKSFRKFLDTSMKKTGSSWVERKLVSQVTSLVYERKDYKFFSLVDIPEEQITYLGIFGMWTAVPSSWDDLKEMFQPR